jgi:hypothetical protein
LLPLCSSEEGDIQLLVCVEAVNEAAEVGRHRTGLCPYLSFTRCNSVVRVCTQQRGFGCGGG